jgi:hypothetical protein
VHLQVFLCKPKLVDTMVDLSVVQRFGEAYRIQWVAKFEGADIRRLFFTVASVGRFVVAAVGFF